MTFLRAITLMIVACIAVVSAHAAAAAAPAQAFTGLWKAKGRFGPDAHGTLIIEKNGAGYIAEMLGRRVAARLDAGELRFELANQQGGFRGKLTGPNILGHWFRFGTPVNGSGRESPVALSPVLLEPDRRTRAGFA